jgi:hypothetical protein
MIWTKKTRWHSTFVNIIACARLPSITFKKEGLAGKGTFGVVQIVHLLKVTSAESDEPVTQTMGQRRVESS